jgi:hypothetical protein
VSGAPAEQRFHEGASAEQRFHEGALDTLDRKVPNTDEDVDLGVGVVVDFDVDVDISQQGLRNSHTIKETLLLLYEQCMQEERGEVVNALRSTYKNIEAKLEKYANNGDFSDAVSRTEHTGRGSSQAGVGNDCCFDNKDVDIESSGEAKNIQNMNGRVYCNDYDFSYKYLDVNQLELLNSLECNHHFCWNPESVL